MVTSAAEKPVPEVPRPPSEPPINEDGHVLKSRRGLLAAGLAVAVVGALGVASTLNAGAEEVPGTPAAAEATAADTPSQGAPAPDGDDTVAAPTKVETPPALLPWGERPQRIKRGRAGESSKSLSREGFAAAPADTSGATKAKPRFAPKGRSDRTSFLKSEKTDIVPPRPVAAAAPSPSPSPTVPPQDDESDVNFLYGLGSQQVESDGFYATLSIAKPTLAKGDYHTLAELAAQSADEKQIVEIGWNVDRVVNGDDDPHLFVYHWVNRKGSCYNACGFVQVSATIKPGDTLAYGVTKKFAIQNWNGSWWVAYDSEWIGYFPEKLWNDEGVKFSRTGLIQAFGEVASATPTPCSQMGNGKPAVGDEDSARIASVTVLNQIPLPLVDKVLPLPAVPTPAILKIRQTSKVYDVYIYAASVRTFRYGGPGACVTPSPTVTPSS